LKTFIIPKIHLFTIFNKFVLQITKDTKITTNFKKKNIQWFVYLLFIYLVHEKEYFNFKINLSFYLLYKEIFELLNFRNDWFFIHIYLIIK
jgi:hypothetical protein